MKQTLTTDWNIPGDVSPHDGQAVDEDNQTHDGSRNQHGGVESQPGKIQAYLLSKVMPVTVSQCV